MTFNVGDTVTFTPARAKAPVTAEVIGEFNAGAGKGCGRYLRTRDSKGVLRKARPSICTLVPKS